MTKLRILLVDDQSLFAQSLQTFLMNYAEDMQVLGIAANGKEACDFVEKDTPDVILMDVRMPVMDGVAATRYIKAMHPNVKIIMLSTYDEEDLVRSSLLTGASGYLLKDISPTELIISIRALNSGMVQEKDDGNAAEVSAERDDKAAAERGERGDEPAADHGKHARDAVDGAFAAPGAVREGCSHRHHERHVSRGKRKLERCAERNQEAREHEIHRGADEVERGAVAFELKLVVIETGIHPLAHRSGNDAYEGLGDGMRPAHDCAGDGARAEKFVRGALRSEGNGSIQHLARLLGERERENHHNARDGQNPPLALFRAHQHGHQRMIRSLSAARIRLARGTSRERHADEVHEVVPREGKRERERAEGDDHFKSVDLQQIQHVRKQSEKQEAREDDFQRILMHGRRKRKDGSLKTPENHKINHCAHRRAAEKPDEIFHPGLVAEREKQAGNVLHDEARGKREGDGYENGEDHR